MCAYDGVCLWLGQLVKREVGWEGPTAKEGNFQMDSCPSFCGKMDHEPNVHTCSIIKISVSHKDRIQEHY